MKQTHQLFPKVNREDTSLLDFAVTFKEELSGRLTAQLRDVCLTEAKQTGHDLEALARDQWRQAAEKLDPDPRVKYWSALKRAQQEFYVDVTASCVDEQLPDLVKTYRELTEGETLGSLTLDSNVKIPSYQDTVDIHCVPGGYGLERVKDDVYPGARSDLGGAVFSMRRHGVMHDDKGVTGARFIKSRYPELNPKRILDIGCTSGNSTLPYVDEFPEAEIFAIDVAAPCLRYAHGRAEALGKKVAFSQQSGEKTNFEDASFDLIVSHILLHEISVSGLKNILAECHRLLRPGGVMLHVEVPVVADNALDQYFANWDSFHNNEPFWASLSDLNFAHHAVEAGFGETDTFFEIVESSRKKRGGWMVLGAAKRGAS